MSANPTTERPVDVAPGTLSQWLDSGDTLLIDVREDVEHAEQRIPGAIPMPLSRFDAQAIRDRAGSSRVVFHCRSGKRSLDAANRYAQRGEPTFHLAGGIDAWQAAGQRILSPPTGRLPIMRQVQIVAGSLVVLGVVLGVTVSPWLLILAGFVGAGLVFAGVSGWCGMAKLLAAMPWNRVAGAS